jgi:DNA-binding MarR family transcriptional regulator/ribosomal protein S18 acetylase RimI-like enzyme
MAKASPEKTDPTVDHIRRFNRFYTRRIGALDEGLVDTRWPLPVARLIYEIAHREPVTATELRAAVGLDAGYLSRLLRGLAEQGVIRQQRSKSDGRKTLLSLTATGRRGFQTLDARSRAEVEGLLAPLAPAVRRRLVGAMAEIENCLGEPTGPSEAEVVLREHRPGDMGWIIHRQAVLYHEEYGWDQTYESLIARIMADFIDHFDPARERCWVATRHEEIVGSVFIVKHPEREGVAKLRLLYVEPSARGLGLGHRLVREVTSFARAAGYHTLTLWTNSVLRSARRIYEVEGYRLIKEEPNDSFGQSLTAQTWELAL